MANVKKEDRVQDTDIKRLNHVGVGLKAISDMLGCHAATITLRLKNMSIKPTDTRRSFMEQVFLGLKPEVQDWLSTNLYNAGIPIKTFVSRLITEAYQEACKNGTVRQTAAPAPLPPMEQVLQDTVTHGVGMVRVAPEDFLANPVDPTALVPIELVTDSLEELPSGAVPETKRLFGS